MSVENQLNSAVASQVELNRQSIIKMVLFCGKKNAALRGHRENETSTNPATLELSLSFGLRVDLKLFRIISKLLQIMQYIHAKQYEMT